MHAPGLRDWQAETSGGRQRVKVRLHAPATEASAWSCTPRRPFRNRRSRWGAYGPSGWPAESGILAVRSTEDVGLEHLARESITRIDAGEAPQPLRTRGGTFYKFYTPDHKLLVAASQLKPRIVVESRLAVLLERARLSTRGEFVCHVSRSGIFALSFRLPAGFQVDEGPHGIDGAVRGGPRRRRSNADGLFH